MNLKIKELIFRINNLIPKEKCEYFINLFEKYSLKSETEGSLKYIEGKSSHYKIDNYKSLNLSKLQKIEDINKATDLINFYINTMVINYINYLKINVSSAILPEFISNISNIRILKYSTGDSIEDHLDVGLTKGGTYIRSSCTLNLNEEYEGGEFTFFSGKHIETFKTGDAMIFPAEPIWVHGTKPIKSGTRYAISCFLGSNYK